MKKTKKENKLYVIYKLGLYFSEESLIAVNWIWSHFWGPLLDYTYHGMCTEELKAAASSG